MSARASIQRSVTAAVILRRLPPQYRDCISLPLLGDQPFDLMIFEPSSSKVVCSKDLQRALRKMDGSSLRPVALAYGFTYEAKAEIIKAGGLAFSLRDFGWSDESWHAVQQLKSGGGR